MELKHAKNGVRK